METKIVGRRGKKVAGWIAAGVATLAISAVGSYHPSVLGSLKSKTQYTGERASDSQIFMADGSNNNKPGGG
jgi:hypothetical protein